MKKSFLFLLISIMTVFLIAGCAEDTTTTDNGGSTTPPTVVPIDPSNPEFLKGFLGTYEIVFFYTDGAGMLSIASDCSKVEYYTGKADAKCVQGHNSVDFKGYGEVNLEETSQTINITTKMQMTNQCLQDPNYGKCKDDLAYGIVNAWTFAQNNQYNYTVFKPIPMNTIVDGALNNGANAVKGVSGRNLKFNTDDKGNSTYKFELLSDGSIRNTMQDTSSVMPANVTVIMKPIAIDSIPAEYTMERDKQFPQPVITGFETTATDATTTP